MTFAAAAPYVAVVRLRLAFALVVLGLALAGCGAQPRGSLVVGIQYTGGAWHASGQRFAGRVPIFDEHGHRVDVLRIKAGNTATAELPPGHYSLGFGHGRPTVTQFEGCKPKTVTVTSSHATDYTLWLGCWLSTPRGVLASIDAAALAQKSVHVTESFAADLYGTDHRTYDVSANSGTELFNYYGNKMRVLLVDHTVYVRADAWLLYGTAYSGLGLTEAQAKRYAGTWISIPKGDKLYARLAAGLTLPSAVGAGAPTYAGLKAYYPEGRLKLSRQRSHGRGLLVLRWTAGAQPPPLDVLKARATGTPLPVSYSDYAAMMVFYNGTYSRWNEPVHVHAPASSTPIATVRG